MDTEKRQQLKLLLEDLDVSANRPDALKEAAFLALEKVKADIESKLDHDLRCAADSHRVAYFALSFFYGENSSEMDQATQDLVNKALGV